MNTQSIVHKIWSLCNVLRGDGISYNQYISELTYLLFLKIAKETETEALIPKGYRWNNLVQYEGENLLGHYQLLLTHLGNEADNENVRRIFAFPTTVFNHSENLRVVVDGIDQIDWHDIAQDSIGKMYEELLAKNSEDARSGAGQYFTPRPLVDCIVHLLQPQLGENIQDPATGTGGFLISADTFIRNSVKSLRKYDKNPPKYQGMEIEKGTHRLCLMNTFLHKMNSEIILGDALTTDADSFTPADVIFANPPFGSKSGSVRAKRNDIEFPSSNKQLDFLQHIYNGLKTGGRAAVVLPDNVLFEGGVGQKIRTDLMKKCNLHTILRLPKGIFYAQGVKTNVLFFTKCGQGTKDVWVYDLRTDMPMFGKRTPLTEAHFEPFITAYGTDVHGQSKRKDEGKKGRFRCFSRESIQQDAENLDIKWREESSVDNELDALTPSEIAQQILLNMQIAMKDVETLNVLLEEVPENR